MAIIYGPVPSWRLGRSLGIDLLNVPGKVCTFNCIYCQLGDIAGSVLEPREFVNLQQLRGEMEALGPVDAEYATFSGTGEPTLAANLGEAIELARSELALPVAVLTNSSLIFRPEIRERLARADVVVAKLDAADEELFSLINRPAPGLRFDQIVEGLRLFRADYRGRLALQIMFVRVNEGHAGDIAALACTISPDEVQINTPLRPSKVAPLTPEDLADVRAKFADLVNVVTVYEAAPPEVSPLDSLETLRRRPGTDHRAHSRAGHDR